jgi:hypothetical protein
MNDLSDRGVDRATLEATERVRARLAVPPAPPAASGRSRWGWALAGALLVFTAGMLASPVLEADVRGVLPWGGAAAPDPALAALQARLAALEGKGAGTTAMPSERLARAEAKVESTDDQIARQSERLDKLGADVAALTALLEADKARDAASLATMQAVADRAEAMLTLLLVRRAMDDGRAIGALEPPLRRLFASRYPAAVTAVATLGQAPATPAQLRRDLAGLRASLGVAPGAGGPGTDWWHTLVSRINGLVSADAAASAGPLEQAEAALAKGNVAAAAAAVRRLPAATAPATRSWLAAADRWLAGQAALATLENGTVLSLALPPTPAITPAASPR